MFRRTPLFPLFHWEEGLGEEVARNLAGGATSSPYPSPPNGGEATKAVTP